MSDDNITAVAYFPPDVIVRARNTPRFGHTDDFAAAFSYNKSEQSNYFLGVIFGGVIVLGVFLLWALTLLSFMCTGHQRVGFFSGYPFVRPASKAQKAQKTTSDFSPTNATMPATPPVDGWNDEADREIVRENDDMSDARMPSCSNRPTRTRSVFLFCGLSFVVFSILIVTQGFANLQSTVNVFARSTEEVNGISLAGLDIIRNGFRRVGSSADAVREQLQAALEPGAFCPANPQLQNSDLGQQIREQTQGAVDILQKLSEIIDPQLTAVEDTLIQTEGTSSRIADGLNQVNLTDWRVMLVLIPYSLVPAMLMAGAVMAMFDVGFDWYTCLINWFLMPLFILMTSVAFVIAGLMIIAGGVNGDFCLPSGRGSNPDETVQAILAERGFESTTTYNAVVFYVSQCRNPNNPFAFIRQAQPQLEAGNTILNDLRDSFADSSPISALSLYCNRDFSGFQQLVNDMESLLALLLTSVAKTLDLVSCKRIVPLYTTTIYDGVCTYQPRAVFWVFASTLVMGVMGMIMITLRSSYKQTIYEDPEEYHDEDEFLKQVDNSNEVFTHEPEVDDDVVIQEVEPERRSMYGNEALNLKESTYSARSPSNEGAAQANDYQPSSSFGNTERKNSNHGESVRKKQYGQSVRKGSASRGHGYTEEMN